MAFSLESKKLITKGCELIGATFGTLAAAYTMDPSHILTFTAIGTAVGKTCETTLGEVASRSLSKREEEKVGAVGAIMFNEIQGRLSAGFNIRDDGFFDAPPKGRSAADEICEGILIKAKHEHEERKLYFMGNLLANIAFDSSCTKDEANHLLKVAEVLTYQQLGILSLAMRHGHMHLRPTSYGPGAKVPYSTISCLQDILDLHKRFLLLQQQPGQPHHTLILDINQIEPENLLLSVGGNRLAVMLGLNNFFLDDQIRFAGYIK